MGDKNEEKTLILDSEQQSHTLENQGTSENLSSTVAKQLLNLMTKVTEDDVNPSTVNAACNCASEISKIIRLNLELKKLED